MNDLIKSHFEAAFKDAASGLSVYFLLSIAMCLLLVILNKQHEGLILCGLMDIKVDSLFGGKSVFLTATVGDLVIATVFCCFVRGGLSVVKSEYFDLLYLTILKKHILILKDKKTNFDDIKEQEVLAKYKKISDSHAMMLAIGLGLFVAAMQDSSNALALCIFILTGLHFIMAVHGSAVFLIKELLPVLVSKNPSITWDQLDSLFSRP